MNNFKDCDTMLSSDEMQMSDKLDNMLKELSVSSVPKKDQKIQNSGQNIEKMKKEIILELKSVIINEFKNHKSNDDNKDDNNVKMEDINILQNDLKNIKEEIDSLKVELNVLKKDDSVITPLLKKVDDLTKIVNKKNDEMYVDEKNGFVYIENYINSKIDFILEKINKKLKITNGQTNVTSRFPRRR